MAISCQQFSDVIARRVEHLDEAIILSMHPLDSQWVGHVSTGRFPAEQGIEHTFDRFENTFPQLVPWTDVQAASCVGSPCDPDVTKIGMGFTRDSYKLQQVDYATDLFCWDLILSADRATQQFAHFVRVLRRASTIIWSHRFRTEALRISRFRWVTGNNTLTAVNAVWNAAMTRLTLTPVTPGQDIRILSKLQARHLQRRVDPQIRAGAEGGTIIKNAQPMLELVTHMETVWNLVEGDPFLADHWRFNQFSDAEKYYRYGWTGQVGNFGLRADAFSLRFDIVSNTAAQVVLDVVFPYTNIAATEGIKEDVNPQYDLAPVQIDFIWHRKAMTSLVRDARAINPEMPFAARDFGGKWQFVMDNLTCGTVKVAEVTDAGAPTGNVIETPIPVNNELRNKGKFRSSFGGAIKAEYPELAEAFISLREPACLVDIPLCADDPGYPEQHYGSSNDPCPTANVVISQIPIINSATGTYEVPANSILCNGLLIVHPAITGSTTIELLVIELNSKVGAMGTWSCAGGPPCTSLVLTGPNCTTINIPWTDSP